MDLDKARHLVALADHGTFNKAATAVNLTQPAFSRSIRALERELGVQLVDRGARQSRLTAYGELIVERARHLLRGVNETRRAIDALRDGTVGELAVGFDPSTASVVLEPFLGEVARGTPALRVRAETGTLRHLMDELRNERLDLIVGPYRPFTNDPDFEVVAVGDSRAGAFVRAGHPLLAVGPLDAAALAGCCVVAPSMAPHISHLLVEALGPAGHPDRLVTMRCDHVPALRTVARGSDAILVSMEASVAADLADGSLVPLELTGIGRVDFRMGVAWLRERTLPPAAARLEAVARRCYAVS